MSHKLGDAFWGIITTHSPSTGAAVNADATPTIAVYKAGTDLALTTPAKYEVTNITTGVYKYWIDWTAGNGFETGKMYSVVMTATVATITQNKQDAIVHCVAKDIDALHDFDQDTEEVDVGSIKGTALTEDSGGNLAKNFSEVYNNDDALTTKVCDDIGGAAASHPEMLLDTDVDTVTDQTHLILTAGANDDDAYNNQGVVIYDASESDSPSVRTITDYDQATKTITLDEAPDFTAVAGDGIKIFVTPPGSTCPTAAQVADAVCDELVADHDVADSVGNAIHTVRNFAAGRVGTRIGPPLEQVIYEDDEGEVERIVRQHVEVSSTEVAMVPQ